MTKRGGEDCGAEKIRARLGFPGKPLISMVPEPGIEPGRPYERGILSPMRLPVSPFGR